MGTVAQHVQEEPFASHRPGEGWEGALLVGKTMIEPSKIVICSGVYTENTKNDPQTWRTTPFLHF